MIKQKWRFLHVLILINLGLLVCCSDTTEKVQSHLPEAPITVVDYKVKNLDGEMIQYLTQYISAMVNSCPHEFDDYVSRSNNYCVIVSALMFGISNKGFWWNWLCEDPNHDGLPLLTPESFDDYKRQYVLKNIDDSAKAGLYLLNPDVPESQRSIDIGTNGFNIWYEELHGTIPEDEYVRLLWGREMMALNSLFFVDMSYSSSNHFGYWYSPQDPHPGLWHFVADSSTAAAAIWTSMHFLFSSDNTDGYRPFPFLVFWQYTPEIAHCVLITGIKELSNGQKYFFVHNPGSVSPEYYAEYTYENIINLIGISTSNYLGRYLRDEESSAEPPAFVIPLFYDKKTLDYFVDEDFGSGVKGLAGYASLYAPIRALPISDIGLDEDSLRQMKEMKFRLLKQETMKRILPIIQMLLED